MIFFDPLYMIVIAVGMVLSVAAQGWVKKKIGKWGEVPIARGLTGRQIAEKILAARGITDVTIEQTQGRLSDHYDPTDKTLRLSPEVYSGQTVVSAGIAAHEVGHAIQHTEGYAPMTVRQKMVPVANIGTNLGVWITIGGMIIGLTGLAKIGVLLFGGAVAFTLVTLPVEFDASARAKKILHQQNFVSKDELEGVDEILTAAGATYLAAAAAAILQLLYFAMRVWGTE